ncbi:MAG: hypothetical protein K8T89_19685 [Planctomycetes bacterium]|nr:hypothetical protein [Planctomycetota bacterium]
MLEFNLERVLTNVRNATTDDLLDRATVYRSEMEPEALRIIDKELIDRGVTVEQVQAHLESRQEVVARPDGTVVKCSFCWKPAIESGWSWHRLFGKIPIFPRKLARCGDHAKSAPGSS